MISLRWYSCSSSFLLGRMYENIIGTPFYGVKSLGVGLVVNFLRVFLGLVPEKFGGCAYFEFAMD